MDSNQDREFGSYDDPLFFLMEKKIKLKRCKTETYLTLFTERKWFYFQRGM